MRAKGAATSTSAVQQILGHRPGRFSGLHLLAIMYTAFRQIDPSMDTGVDFAAEYEAAMKMQGK